MDCSVLIHEKAIVEPGAQVGARSRVWAFAHVLPKAVIGEDCNICDSVFIENEVSLGNRVTVKCGVQLWDGVILEDDVFVGPNATFTNDPFPRSKQYQDDIPRTVVRKGSSIGANATILPGVMIGPHAMVGAGAVVTGNVPPYAIVTGNPARIQGYISSNGSKCPSRVRPQFTPPDTLVVTGVQVVKLPFILDLRGNLSFGEVGQHLPFEPKRYFVIFDVPSEKIRGEHAHRKLHQFLVCLKGSCSVVVDNGQDRDELTLNSPEIGLYLPPMVWATQYKYSQDAILLVLASDPYDPDDYIREYDEYLELVGQR